MSRRPARIALLAALAASAIVIAARATIDADRFRSRIEAAFIRATGRTLHLSGPLRLRLLPSPTLIADDVSIDNIAGGSRPQTVTARRVTAVLDLSSIVGAAGAIESLTLTDPEIILETVDGQPNWTVRRRRGPGSTTAMQSTRSPGGVSNEAFTLSEIHVRGGHLAWRGAGRLGSGEVGIDHLTARQDRSTLTIAAALRHGAAPFTLSVATAPIAQFRRRRYKAPLPLRAVLTIGQGGASGRIGLNGTITSPDGGLNGHLHANLPQLADLNALLPHARLPAAADISLEASVTAARADDWRVAFLRASGERADLSRLRSGLTVDRFTVTVPGPGALASVSARGALAGEPVKINGTAGSVDFWTRRVPDTEVDLLSSLGPDTLAVQGSLSRDHGRPNVQAQLALAAPDPAPLRGLLGRADVRPLFLTGVLHANGRSDDASGTFDASTLRIGNADFPPTRLTASIASGQLMAQAALGGGSPWLTWRQAPTSGATSASLNLDGHDLSAGAISALVAGTSVVTGRLAIHAALRQDPETERRTFDGPVDATLTDGDLAPVVGDLLADVLHAARLPKLGGGPVHIRCVNVVGRLHEGVLTVDRFLLDTPILTMSGTGTVSPDGALDLRLKPTLRLGVTDVTTSVALSGSVDHPAVALAAGQGGRFGLTIGHLAANGAGACSQSTGGRRESKPADLLRAFGLVR